MKNTFKASMATVFLTLGANNYSQCINQQLSTSYD